MRSMGDLGRGRSTGSLRDLRRGRAGLAVAGLVAWALVQAPAVASACAVCTAGRDEENAFAFLMTTIFMSLTPLVAIGTLVFVIWRRMRKLEQASTTTGSAPANSAAGTSMPTQPAAPAAQPQA